MADIQQVVANASAASCWLQVYLLKLCVLIWNLLWTVPAALGEGQRSRLIKPPARDWLVLQWSPLAVLMGLLGYMLLLFILFFIPGVMMIIAYGLISRELYRGMQFEMGQNTESAGQKNGVRKTAAGSNDDDDGCYIQVSKKPSSGMELPTLSASSGDAPSKTARARSNTSQAKLQAKKRVIRMLMVIVALFFICWMPLYTANTWKAFDLKSASKSLSGAPISFIHLLSYSSACVNPIIYCFMNTRFRKALLSTFACCFRHKLCRRCCKGRRRDPGEDGITATSMATSMATSVSKFSYTTVSTTGAC